MLCAEISVKIRNHTWNHWWNLETKNEIRYQAGVYIYQLYSCPCVNARSNSVCGSSWDNLILSKSNWLCPTQWMIVSGGLLWVMNLSRVQVEQPVFHRGCTDKINNPVRTEGYPPSPIHLPWVESALLALYKMPSTKLWLFVSSRPSLTTLSTFLALLSLLRLCWEVQCSREGKTLSAAFGKFDLSELEELSFEVGIGKRPVSERVLSSDKDPKVASRLDFGQEPILTLIFHRTSLSPPNSARGTAARCQRHLPPQRRHWVSLGRN